MQSQIGTAHHMLNLHSTVVLTVLQIAGRIELAFQHMKAPGIQLEVVSSLCSNYTLKEQSMLAQKNNWGHPIAYMIVLHMVAEYRVPSEWEPLV